MSRVIEWDDITPDLVREWAYDEEMLLLEQDEDLLLYDWELLPTMLKLIADHTCPKRKWVYFALCQFTRESVTRGGDAGAASLSNALSSVEPPAEGWLAEWYSYARRILGYAQPTGPIDAETAAQIANDLLLGVAGRVGNITHGKDPSPGWLRFSLETSVTEHVDICPATGEYRYTPWY